MIPEIRNEPKKYIIHFGKEKVWGEDKIKPEIPLEYVKIFETFAFYDYSLNSTVGYLKEYFLTNFGNKYQYCKCELFLYFKKINSYRRLTQFDSDKLKDFIYEELYLIKITIPCNCDYLDYRNYMNMKKFDIIEKLKDLNKEQNLEIEKLKEEIEKLRKSEELKFHSNPKFEDFYDIIIDINSIKNVNKEGWKVKFNEKGLENYKKYKGQDLITIGVIGNSNKGKSFLLSKISKIKLLTGTSIQTEGLSVKYPDLKGYKGRQIILLDSAGLETPVLRTNNKEKEEEEIKENKKEEEEKRDENEIKENKELNDKVDNKEIEQNKEFKENARDKNMREFFLQSFIIKESDILLIVVGKLTYSEQLLINKIKEESKKLKKTKIFIIHNLQEFRTKEQVQDYIKDSLLKSATFNLKKRTWITVAKDREENIKIEKKKIIKDNKDIKERNNEIDIIQNDQINFDSNLDNQIKMEENEDIKINPEQSEEIKINDSTKENNMSMKINNEQKIENIEGKEEKNNAIIENNDRIDDAIVKEETQLNNVHFTEMVNYGDKKLEIYHLILANEDSDAGIIYNQYTYNFIENVYNLIIEPKKFDVFEQVKDNFKGLSSIIFNNEIKEFNFTENEKISENRTIKLNFEGELLLKKCYIDELGFSLFQTDHYEPKYNYFKPDDETIELRVEIPGNVECKATYAVHGDETIITIKGEKKKDSKPEKFEENLFNIREFSEFELNIPLKVQDYQIIKEKDKGKFINGIYIIQFQLPTKEETEPISATGV